jgi:uncharacterized protein YecE (DUF72 family)
VPRDAAGCFPADGSALERYAARFDAVEINSCFYRSHRPATYARWAAATPDGFRFAVKLRQTITHDRRLMDVDEPLAAAIAEARMLGDKLGPLLVQLPPSLAFDRVIAERFLAMLRSLHDGPVALEPRHPSWFALEPEALLRAYRVARVAADPARHPLAGVPGGWPDLAYWRLHGSPRIYYSAYSAEVLAAMAVQLRRGPAVEVWCVFDNTVLGAAANDALALQSMVGAAQAS